MRAAHASPTQEYLAPELLLGHPYGRSVDWWALGTLIYEMIAGLPPFFSESLAEMNERILGAPLVFDGELFSPDAADLLRRLLTRDPAARLGSGPGDADDLKAHAWFRGVDWTALHERRVEPPFVPPLRHALDVQNFAAEFTSEPPTDSYVPPAALLAQPRARLPAHGPGGGGGGGGAGSDPPSDLDAAFANFSYVAPDLLSLRRKLSAARLGSSPLGGSAAPPMRPLATPSPGPDTSVDERDSDEDIFGF